MTSYKKRSKKSNSGFTLLELMIAAGILVFAIVGLLSTFIYGSLLGLANRNLVLASTDAQHVLEKIKDGNVPYDDLVSYSDTSFTNLPAETINVTVSTLTGRKNIVVTVMWTEGQRQRSYALTTNIAQ